MRDLGGRVAWITDREADDKDAELTTATKINLGNVGLWGEKDAFGHRFFLLPNPMYGGWTSAVARRAP